MNDVIKDLSELRLSYEQGELHESQISHDPHLQFLNWFNHALAANLHEPYAMSLATANRLGRPHVRTVLLRGATENGYDFYTNYDSQKVWISRKIHTLSYCFIGRVWNDKCGLVER